MSILERVWELLTNHTWVTASQSYKLNGPPGSYSSAEVHISKGKFVALGEQEEALEKLNEEVEKECEKRMPKTMHALVVMIEENEPR